MKNNFIPHYTPDWIVEEVENEEQRRIRLRAAQLKSGVNPHEGVTSGYIPLSFGKQPPAPQDDAFFKKQNKLRGRARNIKVQTWAEIKRWKFQHRSTPVSELDEE